jgi:transposase
MASFCASVKWRQRNKTAKNDARGLAQLVRSGWFKPVHAKSREANRMKLLLAHRRTLKRKLLDIENEVRQSLKMFGYVVGPRVQRATFQSRIRALVCDDPLLSGATDCMLRCWSALWDEYRKLHKLLPRSSAGTSCADAGARFPASVR